jgi:allantoicase
MLETRLQPHTRHVFDREVRAVGEIERVKLSVFPDGGVARLRLWGDLGVETMHQPTDAELHAVCGSKRWAVRMAALRPFEDLAAMRRASDRIWFALDEEDWLEAFAAHPKIGEGKHPEQAGTRSATAATLDGLALGNAAYQAKFGFIYIVCATGRSADEMLAILERRVGGTRAAELRTAAEEQAKIVHLRLEKLTS